MSVFKRLNSMTKDEVLQRNEKLKQEKELEECTFHPEINPKSAGLFKYATLPLAAAFLLFDVTRRFWCTERPSLFM